MCVVAGQAVRLTPVEPSRHVYPDVWLHTPRGGYGYMQRVPCQVVTQTAARVKIRVPLADGVSVATRYVRPENVERDARLF